MSPRRAPWSPIASPLRGAGAVWVGMILAACAAPQGAGGGAETRRDAAEQIALRWTLDPGNTNRLVVEATGLTPAQCQALTRTNWSSLQWQRLLTVSVEHGDVLAELDLPAMAGDYEVRTNSLWFIPRFPLSRGVRYRAVLRPSYVPLSAPSTATPPWLTASLAVPIKSNAPPTFVRHVYPSAGKLPENLLKFYVHFSAPMRRGQIYDYIHLRNDAGQDIELPFLEIDEELWSPDMTRLTLFIDPGRIKRGVRPLEEVGPSLEEGKRYTLVIDREWLDADSNPLREPFEKRFEVIQPDRQPPEPAQWKIEPPPSRARTPLAVAFPEPMDHALARRVIQVTRPSGESVPGEVALSDQERQWRFTPEQPWQPGAYQLVIQTILEDLAGNNIGKPFEVDVVGGGQRRLTNATARLVFEIP